MDIKLVPTWRVTAEGYTKLFRINLFYLDFLTHSNTVFCLTLIYLEFSFLSQTLAVLCIYLSYNYCEILFKILIR